MHEWGLFGVEIGNDARVAAASGTRPPSFAMSAPAGFYGTGAGKPVLYVHLDEGVAEATFALSLGLAQAQVAERFPPTPTRAAPDATQLRFAPIVARRGRCAAPTPAPAASSAACTATPDGFCEAAEIPRYHGDDDVCLHVEGAQSALLFYRARDLPSAHIPLTLERDGDHYASRTRSGTAVEGPVIFVERALDGTVRYRALAPSERSGPIPADGSFADVGEARALLLAHAMSLGLRASEADAFLDAWAPALFDTCRRTGAEASGTPPAAFRAAAVSLLYFAPRASIDAMVPLVTDPPAREVHRAFLVRVVDPDRAFHPASTGEGLLGLGNIGHGDSAPAAPSTYPNVIVGEVEASGGLESAMVRRVFLRNRPQLTHCYEQALMRVAQPAGDLRVAATVNAQGAVSASSIRSGSLPDAALRSCVAAAVRRWAFPASDSGASTQIEAELQFVPNSP